MRRRTFLAAALTLLSTLPFPLSETNAYSDQTGIYARVDKVVMEPDATAPERIQVWGAFALASKEDRTSYEPAKRGYLYFSCKPGKEEICRKEWADLKSIAGTDKVVGFGGRFMASPRVRKAEEKTANPDEYPLNFGLIKVSDRRSAHPPIPELRSLPRERN